MECEFVLLCLGISCMMSMSKGRFFVLSFEVSFFTRKKNQTKRGLNIRIFFMNQILDRVMTPDPIYLTECYE